jgi:glutamate-1-semialdehyde 2,1-aminomutase
MRAARAYRKRDKILKFEGGYHGMSDYALMSLAPKQPGNFPRPIPDSAGIPRSVQDEMLIAAFNDIDMVESIIKENKDELAGVIVEPFQRLIPPQPGFLQGLRRVTEENGIPLIFDEVVTGFRFAYGGAQEYYGVTPDLCTLGKIIGGGYALAAIAGKAEIMRHFDRVAVADEDFLFQVGTLSGNPVAAIAGLATLEVLKRPGAYEQVFATGRTLMTTLGDLLAEAGMPAQVIGEPPLFDVVFTGEPIRNYRDTLKGDREIAARFNQLLRQKGIMKGDSKYYVSLAHTKADIDWTISAWTDAIAQLRS